MIYDNGKLQQPNSGRFTNVTNPPGMRVKVTSPQRETQNVEVLAGDKGNITCVVRASNSKYHL